MSETNPTSAYLITPAGLRPPDGNRTGWMCAACVHDSDPLCRYGDCHELAQIDTYCGHHFRRVRNEHIHATTNRYRGD